MRKNMRFLVVLGMILMFMSGAFMSNLLVFADDGLVSIDKVFLNNSIQVVINGTLFQAKDPQDGSVYVPITYKGRTYLPLRAVAEAVNMPVEYDSATKTAYLGTKPTVTPEAPTPEVFVNATPEYTKVAALYTTKELNAERLTTTTGKTYEYGYCVKNDFITFSFQCDYKFKKLQFYAWMDDDKAKQLKVELKDEQDVVIKTITTEPGTETFIDIDCSKYESVHVYIGGHTSIIGEPKFVK